MTLLKKIQAAIQDSIEAKKQIPVRELGLAIQAFIETYQAGQKAIFAGNGGSAADSEHLVAEFVGRFYKDRLSVPAISLTTNSATLTAIANDYGYDQVFSRQLEAFGDLGDIFVPISTSGNSENLVQAIQMAKAKGLTVISMTGKDGGKIAQMSDISLCVPHSDTPRIQEAHIVMGHIICEQLELALFS